MRDQQGSERGRGGEGERRGRGGHPFTAAISKKSLLIINTVVSGKCTITKNVTSTQAVRRTSLSGRNQEGSERGRGGEGFTESIAKKSLFTINIVVSGKCTINKNATSTVVVRRLSFLHKRYLLGSW